MRTGKYSFNDLFSNRYIDQIVVPEIQRDYVWQYEQVAGLLSSLVNDFISYQNNEMPEGIPGDAQLQSSFEEFYKKRLYSSNIGFIYAYCDEELAGRYFLIDGQQRITTIYLLLLCLANRNDNLQGRFKGTYMNDAGPKLDYRVREHAHTFFRKFCLHQVTAPGSAEDKTWFHLFYENDVTIRNLISNFNSIAQLLNRYELNEIDFYDYLENYTEFWYFDTNISEQGEELYIYMNARGEHVQSNENIKADLLSRLENEDAKDKLGRKWEDWQDFFWQHRDKNENADGGFNEFLSCLSGLQNYLNDEINYLYSKEEFDKLKGIRSRQILKTLDIHEIEGFIKVLQFLEEKKTVFKGYYNYSRWVNTCLKEVWDILNSKDKTNWYANYNDENRGAERNRMVFLWSLFYYFNKKLNGVLESEANPVDQPDNNNIDVDSEVFIIESFRFLRMYYLRYKNYNRSVKYLKQAVDFIIDDTIGVLDPTDNQVMVDLEEPHEDERDFQIRTQEELDRNAFLNRFHGQDKLQREFEEVIWEIEDHKFNIDGRDVGGINITHLVDFDSIMTTPDLTRIRDKFFEIFPITKNNYWLVQNVLLGFGAYWHRESPYYYKNLRFNNWRRIIRGVGYGDDNYGGSVAFTKFFTDFMGFDGSLTDFYENQKDRAEISNPGDLREWLQWYANKLNDKMWSQGNSIAISEGWRCSLPDWENKDPQFKEEYVLYNTKGNLKGGTPEKLFDKLNHA